MSSKIESIATQIADRYSQRDFEKRIGYLGIKNIKSQSERVRNLTRTQIIQYFITEFFDRQNTPPLTSADKKNLYSRLEGCYKI